MVPHVTNVWGQAGVGVRSGIWKGSVYTIIFDRRTFAPLGMNWTGVTGPMKGTRNGEVVLKTAIVDSTPPLPPPPEDPRSRRTVPPDGPGLQP